MDPETSQMTRRRDRAVRAGAIAAYRVLTNSARYNSARFEIYLSTALNLLFAIIRAGAPRKVPVSEKINRSAISKSEARFWEYFEEALAKLEWQAQRKLRPTQPKIVSTAMSMLPSARGGRGQKKYQLFDKSVPPHLRPIQELMVKGLELLNGLKFVSSFKKPPKDKPGK